MLNLQNELRRYFGYPGFRYDQEEIISAILDGKQVIAVLPTGAGKSLCYQLPALISENFSIVISPLIALMKDQVDNLNKENEVAAFINSTMSFSETEEVFQKITFGKIKLLYLAPERLDSKKFADRIVTLNPAFLFVDEAHCISEWGHNFRPSYTKIKEFIKYCSIKRISAFTATATSEVIEDIANQLDLKNPVVFVKGFERENLHLNVFTDVKKNSKVLELLSIIKGPAIIYTSSRKKAEELAEFINLKGVKCGCYHAGLNSIQRRKIQEDFIEDKLRVIAATNAFGMGIDKKDIRLIIHYNMPGSIENYYQEIGRAGRDNNDSFIYLMYDETDSNIQNYFISNSHPTKELIQNIYNAICDFNRVALRILPDNELVVDEEYISKYCGIEINKGLLHASLKFLGNAGYIKQVSDFEKKDTVKILMSSKKTEEFIRRTSNEEIRNCLLVLLREFGSAMFNEHKQISILQMADLLGISENFIHETLTTLDNLGVISFHPSIKKDTVFLTVPRIEKEHLQLNYKKINDDYIRSKQKLDRMLDYVFNNDCRFKYILNYFGEKTEHYKCGKCDSCTTTSRISDSTFEYLSHLILNTLMEAGSPLPNKSLIMILRGKSEKESFSNFENFGAASNYNKSEIEIIIQNLVSKKLLARAEGKNKYLELTTAGLKQIEESEKSLNINDEYEQDLELYHILRQLRKKASERFLQTQYLLCPDGVLRQVAKEKPETKSELLSINGFNNRMFNKLGNDILDAIKDYKQHNKIVKRKGEIPTNITETFSLLKKKYSLKEIAHLRKLSEPVISMQIETILEFHPDCDIESLIESEKLKKITDEIVKGYTSLTELKNRLPQNISYAQIRIAVAKHKFNPSV